MIFDGDILDNQSCDEILQLNSVFICFSFWWAFHLSSCGKICELMFFMLNVQGCDFSVRKFLDDIFV